MNENENMSFDDAQQAAKQMFSDKPTEQEQMADQLEQQQEQQEQENTANEEALNEAADVAEQAAAAASDQKQQLDALSNENTQLRQAMEEMQQQFKAQNDQIEQLKKQEQQASDVQKEALMRQTMDMPKLDMSELAFADEETAAQMQAEYAKNMSQYIRGQVMDEFSPYIREAEESRAAKERARIIEALSGDEAFSGIKESEPQIMELIGNNSAKFAPDLSEEEKVALGYILSRGVNAINEPPKAEPKPPTVEELMALYEQNPEFQAAVEKKRLDSIKNSQQVPPMSASQGAANAALHIKEKPKNFDDAFEGALGLFGK